MIELTPPEPEPTLSDILEALSVKVAWNKDHRFWQFLGLVTDDNIEILDPSLGTLLDEEDADRLLSSRDRDTVLHIINTEILPGDLILAEDLSTNILDYYSSDYGRHRGPSINIKLHDTYGFWRIIEKGVDWEFPDDYEIDPQYVIWSDTIDWEWDYYMSTVIPEDHPALDTDKFMRLGRSGGHLVYDIRDHALSVPEAWDFMQLEKVAPKYVRYVAAEIVRNQAGSALYDHWLEELEEWQEREFDALQEAVRTNDHEAASRHQANLDAARGQEFYDLAEAQDLMWDVIYKHLEDESVSE
jgi:hypothetical protein